MSALAPLPLLLDYAGEIASATPAGPLALVRAAGGRAVVHGVVPGRPSADALLAWLGARSDVVRTEHRAAAFALEIEYRDAPSRGPAREAFVRSLRDQLFTLNRPPSAPATVELAHATPGRARFRFARAPGDALLRLAAFFLAQPGVTRADPSPATETVRVTFDPTATSTEALHRAALAAPSGSWPAAFREPRKTAWGHAAMNSAVLAATLSGAAPAAAIAVAVGATALPSLRRAVTAARERRLSVDVLDLAAIGISIGTGQPVTAAFITWLLGVGDVVLEQTQDRARSAITKLMKLDADVAFRLRGGDADGADGVVEKVSARKLVVGDLLVVEAGGRVAADGVVVRGLASVDDKALTGEAMPRERSPGDAVLAASVVVEGQLVVRVERVGGDTTAAKIVQILEGAGAKPMTLQRETERTADRLVLPTIGLAGGAAFFAQEVNRMTSVLITDFGTGIRIAVPTAALTAMTLAARRGVLVKGAQYLERLSRADTLVFDKTGTLTSGSPRIVEVLSVGEGLASHDAVRLAAAAEKRQSHPIAEALRAHAASLGLEVPDAELGSEHYTIGAGLSARVEGRAVLVGGARLLREHGVDVGPAEAARKRHAASGASSIFVGVDGRLEAVIGYRDEPRAEAASVVRALQAGGRRRVVLMSGDGQAAVSAAARAVGADRFHAELLPEDKATRVRELQQEGRIVAMVGDGINDAPALAVADVGISLHGGTEVALETADVILLEAGLARLPEAFEVADAAMRSVRRGLGFVIVPNAIAIGLGALGLLAPAGAAIINNGSTVLASLVAASPLLRRR